MPPRGRRVPTRDVEALEQQLNSLKERQAELRAQLKRLRNSSSEVRKLETKLESQLGSAKWTIDQIKELNPNWDERAFYDQVEPKKPTPRGRRPRAAAGS